MKAPVLFSKSTIRTCMVYDTTSGEVIHVHEFLALPGVTPPTERELEAEACASACKITSKARSEIASLHVRREDLTIGVQYIVDLKQKTLIAKAQSM